MKVTLFFSAKAGDGLSMRRLRELIEARGHTVDHLIDKDADLARVLDEGTDAVVAAGGDGTVGRAATAMAGRKIPLAILPLGTANNIAKSLRLEGSAAQLIDRWTTVPPLSIDLGVATGTWGERRFIEAVGGGLIPAGITTLNAEAPRAATAQTASVARAQRRFLEILGDMSPARWILTTDGVGIEEELFLVEVFNTPAVGPNLTLSQEVNAADGLFTVVTVGEAHREALAACLRAAIDGVACDVELPTRHVRRMEIQGWSELHIDDDVVPDWEPGPVMLHVEAGALQVLGTGAAEALPA